MHFALIVSEIKIDATQKFFISKVSRALILQNIFKIKMIFLIKKIFSSKNEIYIIKVRIRTFSQLTIKHFQLFHMIIDCDNVIYYNIAI